MLQRVRHLLWVGLNGHRAMLQREKEIAHQHRQDTSLSRRRRERKCSESCLVVGLVAKGFTHQGPQLDSLNNSSSSQGPGRGGGRLATGAQNQRRPLEAPERSEPAPSPSPQKGLM